MRSSHDDTKNHILDCGQPLIATKGFASVGLTEILQAAAIPKGSFYHYFASKEDYGQSLLARYLKEYGAQMDELLRDDGSPAFERLMRYWTQWSTTQAGSCGDDKCLVVKLGAEVADLSDSMRQTLQDGTDGLIKRLCDCIAEGQMAGSVARDFDALRFAQMLYAMWLGASLLSKLRRDDSALQEALQMTQLLLTPRAESRDTKEHSTERQRNTP